MKFPRIKKGHFTKMEVKNGVTMLVTDYAINGSQILITPFNSNLFTEEGYYFFVEPGPKELERPRRISLFGEIYPVQCFKIKDEILISRTQRVFVSSFFIPLYRLKRYPLEPVILFRLYKGNHYCFIKISSEKKRKWICNLIKKTYPDFFVEQNIVTETIKISASKEEENHYNFYNKIINIVKIVLG